MGEQLRHPTSTQRGLSLSLLKHLLLQLAAHHPVPSGATATRCRCHPVPLYFKAITFHGSSFLLSQPIGFMETLLEFTSQARRTIAVGRHLVERLSGLNVKWGGSPSTLQQAPVCFSCCRWSQEGIPAGIRKVSHPALSGSDHHVPTLSSHSKFPH